MKEERLSEQPESTSAPKKAKPKKALRDRKFFKWFRELASELKKVVWPTGSQIVNNTWVVLVCIVVVGVVLWVFDYVAGEVVNLLINVVS